MLVNKIGINGAKIKYNNIIYKIYQNNNNFTLWINKNDYVIFEAEGRNGGLYFNIKSCKYNNRIYTSPRYTIKYNSLIREISSILMINNYIWDYGANEPLMQTRERLGYNKSLSESMKNYYNKIVEVLAW